MLCRNDPFRLLTALLKENLHPFSLENLLHQLKNRRIIIDYK